MFTRSLIVFGMTLEIIMYIDTHCHLNFYAFKDDVNDVIKRAKRAGVGKFIVIGANLYSSKKAVELAQIYPEVYAAVGIHPHHANEFFNGTIRFQHNLLKKLYEMAKNKKIVAVGEIGLDYYKYNSDVPFSPREKQRELLLEQLTIARELNLPAILHCREAFNDLFHILPKNIRGVLHCFSGGLLHLKKTLDHGLLVGFDGNITYNQLLREAVLKTPIERLLLETDSPYLTPVPYRGERNEPKNIRFVAGHIAKIKKLDRLMIIGKTTENANKLFGV